MNNNTFKKIIENNFKIIDDKYILDSFVGSGGNSIVYSCHTQEGKEYAVKILKNVLYGKNLKRYKEEVSFQKKSEHNKIVKIYDSGTILVNNKNHEYYVMDKYKCDFKKMILEKRYSFEQLIRYYLDICEALLYIHNKGIIHRDIKPENVLYDEVNDIVLLGDFGIAHFKKGNKTTRKEQLTNFDYHAPEQKKNGSKKIGKYTDIYAMGLILNEIFTNQIPNGTQYIKISNVNPIYLELDLLVEKMIRFDINKREHKIENVINYLKYEMYVINDKLTSIEDFFEDDIHYNLDDEIIRMFSKDIYLANYLVDDDTQNIDTLNMYYHDKVKYKVDDNIVDSILLIDIYLRIKKKFNYEGQIVKTKELPNYIDFGKKYNKELFENFCNKLDSLRFFSDLEHIKGKIIKYFWSLEEHHAIEMSTFIDNLFVKQKPHYKLMNFFEIVRYFKILKKYLGELRVEDYVNPIHYYSNFVIEDNLFVNDKTISQRIIELIEKEYESVTILDKNDHYILLVNDEDLNILIEKCEENCEKLGGVSLDDLKCLIKKLNNMETNEIKYILLDSFELENVLFPAIINE